MLQYKPTYCCNCGEKIKRSEWKLWTSRRFCQVCEIEFKGHEIFPKIIAGIAFAFGIFGAGSLLIKSEKPLDLKPAQFAQMTANERKEPSNQRNSPANAAQTTANVNVQPPPLKPPPLNISPNGASKASEKQAVDDRSEAVYYCGAATKKGTPCSRRVKGGGRCWQHPGQPAMLPPDKLLVSGKT